MDRRAKLSSKAHYYKETQNKAIWDYMKAYTVFQTEQKTRTLFTESGECHQPKGLWTVVLEGVDMQPG